MNNKPVVLVTRPEPAATQLCNLLAANKLDYVKQPLLSYKASGSSEQLQNTLLQHPPKIIIFVSKAAVEFAHQIAPLAHWCANAKTILAVGNKTQQALLSLGIQAIAPEQHNSEGLLALPQLCHEQVAKQNILIVRGNGGRETLANTLKSRGAIVNYLESYQRYWLDFSEDSSKIWLNSQINTIVITSGEMLTHLINHLGNEKRYWVENANWLVISERIAELAQQLEIKKIYLSDGANNKAISHALMNMEHIND